MASLVPGFEYDIFISYRQKDNRHDGWVSEFVENLRGELESAFKDEISVFFDINPHDGLLETHDVDASLKEKLKCLVFIPVISRTYCDPKSFAWEHEFKSFIEQASHDRFGLKVRLPNGNVATRVLPVKIHEIDSEDILLCETVLGGVLRGVDFIFRSVGVNRPLRMMEDNPKDNLNKTYYRDQINKVANAVREIIDSLKYQVAAKEKIIPVEGELSGPSKKELIHKRIPDSRNLKILIFSLILFLCLAIPYILVTKTSKKSADRTIAFIPLRTFGDNTLINDASNFVEVVNDKLRNIGNISLVSTMSMLQYSNTVKPLNVIKKELKANYFISGNVKRESGNTIIWVELSDASTNKSLWSGRYNWDKEKIPLITREVVLNISENLDIDLSSEEKTLIDKEPTDNADANLSYISANSIMDNAAFFYIYGHNLRDSISFMSAIRSYDKAIELDPLFALAYAKRSIATSWGIFTNQLDSSFIPGCKADAEKSLEIIKNLPEGHNALGFYYYYCFKNKSRKALEHFKISSDLTPFDYRPLYYMSLVDRKTGDWTSSKKLIHRVIKNNPTEAIFLTNIGLTYQYMHDYDSAIIFHQKAIDLMPDWSAPYLNMMNSILLRDGKTEKAWPLMNIASEKSEQATWYYKIMMLTLDRDYGKALREMETLPSGYTVPEVRYLYKAAINSALNSKITSRLYYDSAIVELNKSVLNYPDDAGVHLNMAIAYAGTGNKKKSLEESNKAIELLRYDSMNMADALLSFVEVLISVGENKRAVSLIDSLLGSPSQLSVKMVKSNPVYDPLRKEIEFENILNKYSEN